MNVQEETSLPVPLITSSQRAAWRALWQRLLNGEGDEQSRQTHQINIKTECAVSAGANIDECCDSKSTTD